MSSTNATELETTPAKPGEARMQASLQLIFERDDGAGRTVLASSRQAPPLRVVRAFALEDGAAMAHLHNVSGGLLGGDNLTLAVEVGPRAQAQLTTTGATRIYRPLQGSAITQQRNEIRVAESGLLEYIPDAIIPFAGANFSQDTSIHLAPDAGLFWWEILAPGREAHNEIFDYECVAMQADLAGDSGRIAAERIRIEPKKYDISSPARMGPYLYCATFYVCREGVQARAWLELEAQIRQIANELSHRGNLRWAISTLKAHGLMIRCLATEGSDVLPGLLSLWDAAKFSLYGRHALPPRKVK